MIHGALSKPDFQARLQSARLAWEAERLHQLTAWTDKLGREYDFVSSFFKQWGEDVTEWFVGASGDPRAPGTNNAAESCIKNTRADAGNVVASIGEVMQFILEQAKHVSLKAFDPAAARPVESKLWLWAMSFSSLFNTDKVRQTSLQGWRLYCCNAREDSEDPDVCNRAPLSATRAVTVARAFGSLQMASRLR